MGLELGTFLNDAIKIANWPLFFWQLTWVRVKIPLRWMAQLYLMLNDATINIYIAMAIYLFWSASVVLCAIKSLIADKKYTTDASIKQLQSIIKEI